MAVHDLASVLHMTAEQARRAHLTTAQIGAATHALHLPLWALVSDTRAW